MSAWVSFETVEPLGTTITRTFGAPRDRVFRAWSSEDVLRQWWGPNAVTVSDCTFKAVEGASYRITMSMDGRDFPAHGTITHVTPDERLSYSVWLDEHPQEWKDFFRPPGTALADVDLHWEYDISFRGEDITTVTVTATYPVAQDRDTMLAVGASAGWNESFEKLDALLERGEC
jgi:uncharacterized protein YndB with AHSA1/START domain